tara:strand:- start:751 stop:1302 length:552 start_codon:yes stop_codon:yes gene_type:complete
MGGIALVVGVSVRGFDHPGQCVSHAVTFATGLRGDPAEWQPITGVAHGGLLLDLMRMESGFGMELTQDDLTLLLLAQNTTVRVICCHTTKNKTGYDIRPECRIFNGKQMPERIFIFLKEHGLPVQTKYTKPEHLNRLLRLLKPFMEFTRKPQGYLDALKHLDTLPVLRVQDDVIKALKILDGE